MLIALLCLTGAASAQDTILEWSYNDFETGSTYNGRDGWEGGYAADDWDGYEGESANYAISATDDDEPGASPGEGGPQDNWLVHEDISMLDGMLTSIVYATDDDTVGMVFNFQDAENYYIFTLTGESGGGGGYFSNPYDEVSGPTAMIVRVEDGDFEILETADFSYETSRVGRMAVSMNDGELVGMYWGDSGDDLDSPDETITVTDGEGAFGAGSAGVFAYNMGGDFFRGEDIVAYGAFELYAFDDDGDGIADDFDNCEFEANEDQADADGDGIGSACDDDEGGDDGGDGDDGDDGGDGGGDGGDGGGDGGDGGDPDIGFDTGLTAPLDPDAKLSTCACSGGGGAMGGLVLAMLAGLRRRRE